MAFKFKKRPLNSCLSLSLRTGTIITGALTIIAAILTMIYVITTNHQFRASIIPLPESIVKIVLVINLCMTIFLSSLLILGVFKERKFFLVIWIILGAMLIINWVLSVIYWGVMYLIQKQYFESVVTLIAGFILAIIYFYLWLVVYCYYLYLKEQDKRLPYYKRTNNMN